MCRSDIVEQKPLGEESFGAWTDNNKIHPGQTGNKNGCLIRPTLDRIQWRALV
jgi:hypothetical protein